MLICFYLTHNPNNLGRERFIKYTGKKKSRRKLKCGVEWSHSVLYVMCVEIIQILT